MGLSLDIRKTHIYAWPEFRDIEFIKKYMRKEWAWYFSGNRDHKRISESAKLWGDIKNPDGSLNSNYGYLVFYSKVPHPSLGAVTLSPFQWAFECLANDNNTRQAMVTYNTSGYNFSGNKDYICSQHQAFYIRHNRLDCYVALRSSDLIFGLTYNMPWWSLVAQQMHLLLTQDVYPKLELGEIKVSIYSAHIYKRHYKLVERMISSDPERWAVKLNRIVPLHLKFDYYEEFIDHYISLERG